MYKLITAFILFTFVSSTYAQNITDNTFDLKIIEIGRTNDNLHVAQEITYKEVLDDSEGPTVVARRNCKWDTAATGIPCDDGKCVLIEYQGDLCLRCDNGSDVIDPTKLACHSQVANSIDGGHTPQNINVPE